MSGSLLPQPKQMFQTDAWAPGVGYKICTYVAGSSLVEKDTFNDPDLASNHKNANPVIANARGEVVMYGTGTYRVILKDVIDNTVYDVDNISVTGAGADTLTASLAAPSGSGLIGTPNSQAPAYLKTVSDILNGDMVLIDRFLPSAQIAAIRSGSSTYNCAPDLNAALPAFTNGGGIAAPQGTYYATEPVIFGANSMNVKFISTGGAILLCAHNGNGIDMTSQNENYGGHSLENWIIRGPNVSFPSSAVELSGASTGAAVVIANADTNSPSAYGNTFKNCMFEKFKYGMRMQAAIWCKIIGGFTRFNQYGIYIDGGQSNANNWYGHVVRENRVLGLYSIDRSSTGALSYATANVFHGGGFETNIPYRGDNPAGYSGGYPTTFNSGGTGTAVCLENSYDFIFDDAYFENHNYSVWLDKSSDSNVFKNCRFAPGGAVDVRVGGVRFQGAGISTNTFDKCKMIGGSTSVVNVTMNNASQLNNQFLDCEGFVFDARSATYLPYVRNNRLTQAGGGGANGAITVPDQGTFISTVGTGRGQIDSMSSSTATLNVSGLSRIELGNQITTPGPKISLFSNLIPDTVLVLHRTDQSFPVTINSGAIGNGANIICKNGLNAVLDQSGQTIVFWINRIGQAVEIGRNWDSLQGSATFDPANLADGAGLTTTVTCTGAALGDFATASFSLDLQGITLTAWVSSANTVSVRFQNESGGALDLASATLRVRVSQGV